MRALITDGNGGLRIGELAMPEIDPYQALTRTVSCGVCAGTDSKLIHGHFKGFDAYPASLGHEAIGEVVQLGERVTSFQVGDLVTLPFLYEGTDGVAVGWGSFAEYGVVGDAAALLADGFTDFDSTYLAQKVIKPTDKVTPTSAAMVVTFREVYSAVRRFGMAAGETAVIFGAGPVGLSFTRFASLVGLSRILVVDLSDAKIAAAAAAGATDTLDSTAADPVAWVRGLVPEGVDYVVDAVGVAALLNQGMAMVKDRGKLCAYGISPHTAAELDWTPAPYNWTLQFQQFPRKDEEGAVHDQVMAWINSGQLVVDDWVSDVVDFDEILDAFALVAEHRPTTKKVVVSYQR